MIKMKKPPFLCGGFPKHQWKLFRNPFLRHRHQALVLLILALACQQLLPLLLRTGRQ
jgi:hypothetical protein